MVAAPRRRWARRGAALVLLVAGASGCPKRSEPPAPRVVEIRVALRGAAEGEAVAGLDAEALSSRVAGRLRNSGVLPVTLGEAARPGVDYRLTVEARVQDAGTEHDGLLRALVSSRLARVGGARGEVPIRNDALAERTLPAGQRPDDALVRAHLERAVDDVIDGLLRVARVRTGSTAERLAALSSSDEELRREAARGVAERRERAAVPLLVPLLKDERPEVRDLALGALIEIGDPSAARPIAEMARIGDAAQLPRIIDAMAVLGGDEARAYLEFVISAHDDEELRAHARAALARLDHRGAASGAPAGAGTGEAAPRATP